MSWHSSRTLGEKRGASIGMFQIYHVQKGGVDAIKMHPFFDGIDWNKLYAKRMNPPIVRGRVEHAAKRENFEYSFFRVVCHVTQIKNSTRITHSYRWSKAKSFD